MAKNKVQVVRDHILNMLENREIHSGERIAAAREIAEQLGVSFLKVQQAVESLCQDGVLYSHSRKGTFVQENWHMRVLAENICVYNPVEFFPWIPDLLSMIEGYIPGLRSTFAFRRGMLELRTTSHVLTEFDSYMDLSPIFEECYPDRSVFFEKPFRPFEVNQRMVGIPFAFSPRVIFYRPSMFKKAGIPLPSAGWKWDDFINSVEALKKVLPKSGLINWSAAQYLLMVFILRAGGRLFAPGEEDPVTLDSPEVLRGLELFRDLGARVERVHSPDATYHMAFMNGGAAMYLGGRHFMDFILRAGHDDWDTAPLPLFDGGVDSTAQATDLICVRKSCASPDLAKQYVKAMLSEEVQDFIGQQKHNIPIRRSSAFKSLNLDDPRDSLFAAEISKISTDFNLQPPFPGAFVLKGLQRIIEEDLDIKSGLDELASAARTIIKVNGEYSPN